MHYLDIIQSTEINHHKMILALLEKAHTATSEPIEDLNVNIVLNKSIEERCVEDLQENENKYMRLI